MPLRWWDLPAAALLIVALVTAATRLVVTQWTDYLSIVQTLAFFGAIAGLALGQSRFSLRVVFLLGLIYGMFAIPWQLGLTVRGHLLWSIRMDILEMRLTTIFNQLLKHQVVQDSLLFVVLMSVLFWLLSVYAGYTLTRYGNAWRAILPTGLTLFAIHSFDSLIARRAWYLAVFLFFALVLVARVAYLHQHNRWQQSRTALPPHLGLDFIRFTLLAAGLIVVFSWTAPALANAVPAVVRASQPLRQSWNEVRDRADNAFAGLKSSVGVVSDYYGNSVLLGRGNRLTDSQVFAVKVPSDIPSAVRLYWRARTYDTFTGDQWLSTIAGSHSFNPKNDVLKLPDDKERWAGTFEIIPTTYISTLFSPPQPMWVSKPSQTEYESNSDGTVDISAFRATPALSPGQVYQVQASISDATIAALKASGSAYPTWATSRYLQLPDSITPRTKELALQITSGMDNPYDKAVAITNYLRNNINYSETVPSRPSGQDSIDWFLFDLRQGFCNYYASAEVILLRTLGIPARWSVGYAQGESTQDGTYIVRQRDAHAWPEVYFTGLGWVEFEPTASQQPLVRGIGDPSQANNQNLPDSANDEALRQQQLEELQAQREDRTGGTPTDITRDWRPAVTRVLLVLAAAVFAYLLWRASKRINFQAMPIVMESTLIKVGIRPPNLLQQWARRAALPPLSKAYLEINHALSRLGSRPALTATPAERAASLSGLVPPAKDPAQVLVSEYEVATFSPQPADLSAARQAGSEIRTLSYKALLRKWLARLQQRPKIESWPWNKKNFRR